MVFRLSWLYFKSRNRFPSLMARIAPWMDCAVPWHSGRGRSGEAVWFLQGRIYNIYSLLVAATLKSLLRKGCKILYSTACFSFSQAPFFNSQMLLLARLPGRYLASASFLAWEAWSWAWVSPSGMIAQNFSKFLVLNVWLCWVAIWLQQFLRAVSTWV